jgi:hypothetical protein
MTIAKETLELGELTEQRRDTALDASAFHWERIPQPIPAGFFPLEKNIALKVGLPPGTLVDVDQFTQLLIRMHLPKSRKKPNKGKAT